MDSVTYEGGNQFRLYISHRKEQKLIYSKISYGYVVQSYDSETGDCVEQLFVPDERVERQDPEGEPIPDDEVEELANTEKECSFDMVQP
jgi:hypothetical protein